ncbi:MAG: hypothetical protein LBF89_10350 [Bacteroidales bacterium]|nr:hypothetical protein [Bacteroidales bacterium]
MKRKETGIPATLPQQEARYETGGTANRRIQPERYVQCHPKFCWKIYENIEKD